MYRGKTCGFREYSSPSNINPTTEVSKKYVDILAELRYCNAENIGRRTQCWRIERCKMVSAVSVTVYLYSNGLDISYFQFLDQTNQIAALAQS